MLARLLARVGLTTPEQRAWAWYDCGNSAYFTTVVTAVFPILHRLLKSGGSLTMIYPTTGTDRIIRALGRKFGAIEIFPLWPRVGVNSKRVIIRARKDRQTPCTIHAGLVLHAPEGGYTPEADAVLKAAHPLF